MSDEWRRIGASAALAEGRTQRVQLDGADILLVRVGGVLQAVANRCTHADACLHEGRLRGHRLICPLHGASFDVRTGATLSAPATVALRRYEAREAEGDIFLLLPPASS